MKEKSILSVKNKIKCVSNFAKCKTFRLQSNFLLDTSQTKKQNARNPRSKFIIHLLLRLIPLISSYFKIIGVIFMKNRIKYEFVLFVFMVDIVAI
jgi:hypothetical protein